MPLPLECLTVWASVESPPSGTPGPVYRWDGHSDDASTYSLLRLAEEHGEPLRRRYLSWVHAIGEHRIGGKRLIEHLAIGEGQSYWWLTAFVEKNPYRTPITDVIRLFVVEELLIEFEPQRVRFEGGDARIAEVLRGLCERMGIAFDHTGAA